MKGFFVCFYYIGIVLNDGIRGLANPRFQPHAERIARIGSYVQDILSQLYWLLVQVCACCSADLADGTSAEAVIPNSCEAW